MMSDNTKRMFQKAQADELLCYASDKSHVSRR